MQTSEEKLQFLYFPHSLQLLEPGSKRTRVYLQAHYSRKVTHIQN